MLEDRDPALRWPHLNLLYKELSKTISFRHAYSDQPSDPEAVMRSFFSPAVPKNFDAWTWCGWREEAILSFFIQAVCQTIQRVTSTRYAYTVLVSYDHDCRPPQLVAYDPRTGGEIWYVRTLKVTSRSFSWPDPKLEAIEQEMAGLYRKVQDFVFEMEGFDSLEAMVQRVLEGEDAMRDPSRIDRVLALVGKLWKQSPDLRLGQLLMNLTTQSEDLYYLEDDDLEQRLRGKLRDKLSEKTTATRRRAQAGPV